MVTQKIVFVDMNPGAQRDAVLERLKAIGNVTVVADLATAKTVVTDKPNDYRSGEKLRGKKIIVIAPPHVKSHPEAIRVAPGQRAVMFAMTKI